MKHIFTILRIVRAEGPIKCKDVSKMMGISDRTVRHNLKKLCDEGLVLRYWKLGDTRITYYRVKP